MLKGRKKLCIIITLIVFATLLGYFYFCRERTKGITDKDINLIEVSTKEYNNECYKCSLGVEEEKYDGKNKVIVTNCDIELLESIDIEKGGKGNKIRNKGKEFKLYNIDINKAKEYEKDGLKTDTYELTIKLYLNYEGKKVLAGEIRCYRLSELNEEKFSSAEIDKIKSQVSEVFKDKPISDYTLFGKFSKAGSDDFRIEGGMYPESGFFQTDYTTQIEECKQIWGTENKFLTWCRQFNSVDFYQGQEYSESGLTIGFIIYMAIVVVICCIEFGTITKRLSLSKGSV